MKRPEYPLEQVSLIKQKRLEEAEKRLKEKKEALERELEKQEQLKKKLKEIQDLKKQKVAQFLKELEEGTTSDKINLHETFIKEVINEKLKAEEKKVKDQKEVVKKAEEAVEVARKERFQRNQDVEKMHLHKKEWLKQVALEEMRVESSESDEMGTNIHTTKKREGK